MQLNLILLNFLRETSANMVDVASTDAYIYQIYVPVIAWLVLVLLLLIVLLFKYTFKTWTVENPNPYVDESLGMPRGTFRSILTLTLLYVAVILELVSVHTPGFEENVSQFLTAFQMMIAFYFGSKVMHHITTTDKQKAKLVVDESKARSEALKTISSSSTESKKEVVIEVKKEDPKIENKTTKTEDFFDDGSNEGIDENEKGFDEEKAFGGDDPDAKG
jgi:hypothetical protein